MEKSILKRLKLDAKDIDPILNNIHSYYLSYPIAKSDKRKLRWIDAPLGNLKALQYKILYNIVYKIRPHDAAVGFRINRSVKTGAARHLGYKVILTMDISNFFNSIKMPWVHRILNLCAYRALNVKQTIHPMEIDNTADFIQIIDANYLAQICCYKNQLPQGAPTSPAIANLYAMQMDSRLKALSDAHDLIYTRYADDMTFSHADPKYDIGRLIKTIEAIVKEHSLKLNHKKTRILRPHRRMNVTGVVINDKLGVPKYVWRNMRAKLHNLVKENQTITLLEYQQIRGKCEWIKSLNQKRGDQLLKKLSNVHLINS